MASDFFLLERCCCCEHIAVEAYELSWVSDLIWRAVEPKFAFEFLSFWRSYNCLILSCKFWFWFSSFLLFLDWVAKVFLLFEVSWVLKPS